MASVPLCATRLPFPITPIHLHTPAPTHQANPLFQPVLPIDGDITQPVHRPLPARNHPHVLPMHTAHAVSQLSTPPSKTGTHDQPPRLSHPRPPFFLQTLLMLCITCTRESPEALQLSKPLHQSALHRCASTPAPCHAIPPLPTMHCTMLFKRPQSTPCSGISSFFLILTAPSCVEAISCTNPRPRLPVPCLPPNPIGM